MESCSISIGGIELIINFKKLLTDGNHENFDRLYAYPVEMWHGGKVHKIRPSVIHLMRGQIFELEEKKIFTFGGASSHDISAGILEPDDPKFKLKKKFGRQPDLKNGFLDIIMIIET